MKYIVLNDRYSLRNERTCSYIVRKSLYVDSDLNNYQTIYPIPPFLGYIISNIGKMEYSLSIIAIGEALGIDSSILQHFLSQIVGQPSKSVSFLGKEIVFPEHLLIYSTQKDEALHFSVKDFSPMNAYIQCRPQTPVTVNFMVTEKCNTNCIYCYAKRDTKKELSTSEILNLFQKISNTGIVNLTLTGGDIFARDDWYDIISLSKNAGFNNLISTKTILDDINIFRLKQLGIQRIQFSLDSVSPDILKDVIKVSRGYVEKLKTMFHTCNKYEMEISLRTVLCRQNSNIEAIKELCDFVEINKCIVNWVITPAFYSENKENYNDYAVSNEKLKRVFSYLQTRRMRIHPLFNKINKDGYILQRAKNVEDFVEDNQICYANTYSMSILPSGDCTVCEMLYYNKDFILGNIKYMSIDEIWNSKKALDLYSPARNKISKESACSSCAVFDICKGSIAKRVCYVDIMKVHKHSDYPDPKCPQSLICDYIL